MKNSSMAEIAGISSLSVVCSFRALSAEDKKLLHRFYLDLNSDERRHRFGGAVSDESITRHCAGIDWNSVVVLACFAKQDILSVVELHPVSSTWDRAELARSGVGKKSIFLTAARAFRSTTCFNYF